MAQIKVYGIAEQRNPVRARLSDAIHACVVEALQFPADKRAHRFFPMDASDFFIPGGQDRTARDTLIEISMFEGRSVEITITETPRHNWRFRGQTGDQVDLSDKVDV